VVELLWFDLCGRFGDNFQTGLPGKCLEELQGRDKMLCVMEIPLHQRKDIRNRIAALW